ncbi:Adenylate kinase 2 [Scheffersomyces spartinae]|uniref:GTP:AMP phosphotransferase, mitochondrial n=1 Tax=Scheffersomyces spartinae TaxID=45513 RepID=A0A9P7VD68_9ASCO|nr:Adenylate kinase 2 [Scheffersomyces spartinae]KAG7195665.1 Adenylate kinase 2 [Scheffersomyces spartinae]
MSSFARPLRLLLLGAPGSGKGTQTSKLLKKYSDVLAISSGDLLRQEIARKSTLGQLSSKYIAEGKLIPDEHITKLISNYLAAELTPTSSYLLDGFPRTINQGRTLHESLKQGPNLNLVVELDVDQNVILDRIEKRWVHTGSGRVYNLDYNPPKVPFTDDVTGEPLSKRVDDTREVFSKRLESYNAELGPLKDFYNDLGILETISGDSSDIIFPKLAKFIEDNYVS